MTILEQVAACREAAGRLAVMDTDLKNAALLAMAELLARDREAVLAANARDAEAARSGGLAEPLYKRLLLSNDKMDAMAESLRSVAALEDPVGRVELVRELDEGLTLRRVRVPIGVVGVIFESRPDALVQIAALAIKSGNAVVLKGGSEALHSNRALHGLFVRSLAGTSPAFDGALALVETRAQVGDLLGLDGRIDLLIPRGSNALVRHIQEHTRIPVLGHADGVCHLYVDEYADPDMAVALARDAKTQYPAVCNAIETLLIHRSRAALLERIREAMPEVELRGCERTRAVVPAAAADEADWATEYNDLVLSVRVVDDLDEAIRHVNRYGSHHTDAIVTEDPGRARRFMREVDSSSVLWNASTRFADGYRYGLGAEVGISTGKVHARGPVGLEGLTTTQYRVEGTGQVVADYVEGRRTFTHREMP